MVTPASCPTPRKQLPGVNAPSASGGGGRGSQASIASISEIPESSGRKQKRKGSTQSLGPEPISRGKSDTNLSRKGSKKDGECSMM